MKIRITTLVSLAALATIAGALGGCGSSSPARQQLAEIRANPSPELQTTNQTEDDVDNQLTVTFDENFRQLNRDLGVLFLTDRPTRLSPYPTK